MVNMADGGGQIGALTGAEKNDASSTSSSSYRPVPPPGVDNGSLPAPKPRRRFGEKAPGFETTVPSFPEKEKRKPTDDTPVEGEPEKKKAGFSMTFNKSSQLPKISMKLGPSQLSEESKKPVSPIKMTLSGPQKPKESSSKLTRPSNAVSNVFNQDDDEDEEMPPEAKMRMRNIGRETPTAAGPNSFGKNNLGFCDRQKIIQREIQKKMDQIGSEPE